MHSRLVVLRVASLRVHGVLAKITLSMSAKTGRVPVIESSFVASSNVNAVTESVAAV